jgi:hypothetical protein
MARKAHNGVSVCNSYWFLMWKPIETLMDAPLQAIVTQDQKQTKQNQFASHHFRKVDLMNRRQLSLEKLIRKMPEPPPPPQDASVVMKEKPLPTFPSCTAKPFKDGQLHELSDHVHAVWDNKGKGISCTYFAAMVSFVRLEGSAWMWMFAHFKR